LGYYCWVLLSCKKFENTKESEDDDWMNGGRSDRDDGFMIVYNPH